MKKLYPYSFPFLAFYLLTLFVVVFVLFNTSKADIHLAVNSVHSSFLDGFFKLITRCGEGVVIIPVSILFLFIRYKDCIALLTSYALGGLIAQSIKHLISNDPRPYRFFTDLDIPLYTVPGVQLHEYNTFPSGHTTAAFGFCFMLSLLINNKWASVGLFVLAVLVAYSRMYLSLHFLVDVTVGSCLGTFVSAFVYSFYYRNQWSDSSHWLNRSIKI